MMATRPDTCLRCRGRKWTAVPAGNDVVMLPSRCPRCKGSGCRRSERPPAAFSRLPSHPGLVAGPTPLAGEIADAR
jgi:hypothetical protein